ncbi:MAG TPA: hypothetical protein VIS74_00800 [Chthoniobacterales bacterium]
MIHANCRVRLTADDFDFIVRALSTKSSDAVSLPRLLTDESTRDELLDHEVLTAAILESPETLRISPRLLFYVLCRKVLRKTAVRSRESADYIASLLERFQNSARLDSPDGLSERQLRYLSDMLLALSQAGPREAFILRAHIGNYSLFLSGMFADSLEKCRRKGGPGLSFYEQVGRSSFQAAAGHREAQRFQLDKIYRELADGFHEARLALNDLARRLLHLDTPPAPIIAIG